MKTTGRIAIGVTAALLTPILTLAVLTAAPAGDSPPSTAPAGEPPALEGSWEGFIIETPARLSRLGFDLKRAGEGWEGTIDLSGAPPGLPLSAIRADGAKVHFELQVGEILVVFDATYKEVDTLAGRVVEGERSFTFATQKLPVYATPADRVEGWKQDLNVVRTRFMKYDRSFSPEARAAFEKSLDAIEASLGEKNDQEIIVALSEAVALSGNAHTRLYLLRNRTELRRLPVRLYWFSDGLFVVRATADQKDLVGCRVSRLAGRDPREVRERVGRLFAGNESWVNYKSPYFMTSPEILYGLGLIKDMERVPIAFACAGRKETVRELEPLPLQRSGKPTEAWRDLSPLWPVASAPRNDGTGEGKNDAAWASGLTGVDPVPLYLRDPRQHYWFEYMADSRTLYLQYNRSQNMPEGASFDDFAAEVEMFLSTTPVERLIVDLRFNTGGNKGIARRFMGRLVELERSGKLGRLYVITGRSTFSAGISHVAHLKDESNATFVGEPVGDVLDTWSEGGNIVLPNSGLTVHFTNGFHSLSKVKRPELEKYKWSDLDLDDLDPDIEARFSSGDYFSGRDPVLAAILSESD